MRYIVMFLTMFTVGPAAAQTPGSDKCTAHGAATPEALAAALAATDAETIKTLAVDECAFRKAQFVVGSDMAEALAKVARGDALANTGDQLKRTLARLTNPMRKLEDVALEAGQQYVARFGAGSDRLVIRFLTTQVDGRWYLANAEVLADIVSPAPRTFEDLAALALRATIDSDAGPLRACMPVFDDFVESDRKGMNSKRYDLRRNDWGTLEYLFARNLKVAKSAQFNLAAARISTIESKDLGAGVFRITAKLAGTGEASLRIIAFRLERGLVLEHGPTLEVGRACERAVAAVKRFPGDPEVQALSAKLGSKPNMLAECNQRLSDKGADHWLAYKMFVDCIAIAENAGEIRECARRL